VSAVRAFCKQHTRALSQCFQSLSAPTAGTTGAIKNSRCWTGNSQSLYDYVRLVACFPSVALIIHKNFALKQAINWRLWSMLYTTGLMCVYISYVVDILLPCARVWTIPFNVHVGLYVHFKDTLLFLNVIFCTYYSWTCYALSIYMFLGLLLEYSYHSWQVVKVIRIRSHFVIRSTVCARWRQCALPV